MSSRFWVPASAVMLALLVVACREPSSTTNPEPSTTASMAATSPNTAVTTTSPTTTNSTTTVPEGPTEIEIEVEGGNVTGGGRIPVELGTQVRLQVMADVTDEVHLHGYDLSAPVTPEFSAVIEFTADIPGIFEIELEESGLGLAELEVAP